MDTAWETETERVEYVYAGFWRRFLAYILDSIIIGIPGYIVSTIVVTVFLGANAEIVLNGTDAEIIAYMESPGAIQEIVTAFGLLLVLNLVISVLYFAVMESSSMQATVGKKMLGLRVTTLSGKRISFGRAFGRLLVKSLLSPILMIGYIMAAFTEKKQSLHDLVASTLVLKKRG